MAEPTRAQRRRFLGAARLLAALADEGCEMYLAEDTLNLMSGPSHDDGGGGRLRPRQDRVRESVWIRRSSGGDW